MNGFPMMLHSTPQRHSSPGSPGPSRQSSGSDSPRGTPTTPRSTPRSGTKSPWTSDRFIPDRTTMNTDASKFWLSPGADDSAAAADNQEVSPAQQNTLRLLKENLFTDSPRSILSFQGPPRSASGFEIERRALLEVASVRTTKSPVVSDKVRMVNQNPDRILDAPDLRCDFYLNVLDWGPKNVIAIALGDTVYLWDAGTGSIHELYHCTEAGDYVSSLSWAADGTHLSIGTATNQLQLWDADRQSLVRVMRNDYGRIAATAWNGGMLSAGSKSGAITNHDVRVRDSTTQVLRGGHSQEVCGLRWSPDGRYLASGGNDNIVNVWDATGSSVHRYTRHTAAVKAIAWCPWHPSTLATGGGTDDRSIKLWNVNHATRDGLISSTSTRSQISSLQWNSNHRELLSSHGFSDNFLSLWKYRSGSLTRFSDLKGHTERILATAMSPDQTTVVSAGADETLRFWKCFESTPRKKGRGENQSKLMTTLR